MVQEDGREMSDANANVCQLMSRYFPGGYAHHRMITDDDGTPLDSVLIDANREFMDMVGGRDGDAIGSRISVVFPELGQIIVESYVSFAERTRSHGPLDACLAANRRNYRVRVFSDRPGYMVTLVHDVTVESNRNATAEKLAQLAREHLQNPVGHIDCQLLTDEIRDLSGAKYAALNVYEPDGSRIVTKAVSGLGDRVHAVTSILGFSLVGSEWETIPVRSEAIREDGLIMFDNLWDAASGSVSRQVCSLLEKVFKTERIYVIAVSHRGECIGDFILFMAPGDFLGNPNAVQLLANQIGIMMMRARAERALKEKEQQLRDLVENQTELICRYLPDGTLTFVNSAYSHYLGVPASELLGQNFFAHFEAVDDPESHVDPPNVQGEPIVVERRCMGPSDEFRWQQWTDRRLTSQPGNPVEWQSVGRDITSRKRAETELEARTRFLESRHHIVRGNP